MDVGDQLERRKTILQWMIHTDKRDYRVVGDIVFEYEKYPEELLLKAKQELNA